MASSVVKKVLSFLGLLLLGVIGGIAISFYIMLVLSVPQTDGEITLSDIDNKVEIYFDSMGIPQIYAETEQDAYFALGYQHASDRMFQMDLSRRVAEGKLSELLGSVTKSIDAEQIAIGHLRIAVETEKNLSDRNRMRLQAYSDGINKYSEICKSLPFEYRFLPVAFAEWTVTDCLALLSFQTWYSNSLMNRDQFYNQLAEKVGKKKAETLLFPYPDFAPVTVEKQNENANLQLQNQNIQTKYNFSFQLDKAEDCNKLQQAIAEQLFCDSELPFQMSKASNAWVVAPSRSQSGSAMLASDPHLELGRLPQFWYAVGLHIKETTTDVFGITTPGLPFVVMGHNKKSAWAFTAGGNDIVEYKTLQLLNNGSQYLSNEEVKDITIVTTEHINSSVDNPEEIITKITDYGVIMKENDSTAIVMHWAGYDVDLNLGVTNAFKLIDTKTFEEFRNTITNFCALDANYMYADSNGTIGYHLSTPLPTRQHSTSTILPSAEGTESGYSFHSIDETPYVKNPAKGWIANCNNMPEHSEAVQGFYFADRILRIDELLNSKEKFTISDMQTYQFDLHDRYLQHFASEFSTTLQNIGEDTLTNQILDWDGSADTSSYLTALINIYLDILQKEIFEDELGELYGQVPAKWIENVQVIDDAGWYDNIDTDKKETADEIQKSAMQQAIEIVGNKRWGDLQTLTMKHPLSIIPIVSSALHLETESTPHGGTPGTLNSSFSHHDKNYNYTSLAGASMRLLVDFSDLDATTIVLPAGNSGNPMSDHFFDFYEMWKNNKRWNVSISDNKIFEQAKSKLTLLPQN